MRAGETVKVELVTDIDSKVAVITEAKANSADFVVSRAVLLTDPSTESAFRKPVWLTESAVSILKKSVSTPCMRLRFDKATEEAVLRAM
jgi:hypothetical protein